MDNVELEQELYILRETIASLEQFATFTNDSLKNIVTAIEVMQGQIRTLEAKFLEIESKVATKH